MYLGLHITALIAAYAVNALMPDNSVLINLFTILSAIYMAKSIGVFDDK